VRDLTYCTAIGRHGRRIGWSLAGPVAVLSLIVLIAAAGPSAAQGAAEPKVPRPVPGPGWVTLPLSQYLELVDRAEKTDRGDDGHQTEEPVAEVASQRTVAVVDDGLARLETTFRVELRGQPTRAVVLPFAGLPGEAAVEPRRGAALDRDAEGRLRLVAPEPGSFKVTVQGRRELDRDGGIYRLPLPASDAPVAVTELDLPSELAWTAPGAVVAEEREDGPRRHLRLALPRGKPSVIELRRRTTGAEEEKVLARAVQVTLLEILPRGLRRHDIVLYEVLRGELGRFQVELPPGLEVEVAATDEGEVVPLVDDGRLTVERHRRLSGVGYLALTSRPSPPPGLAASDAESGGTLDLASVTPSVPVRARYLVTSTSVAASIEPRPADAWRRVDEEDLPAALSRELGSLDLSAVWRAAEPDVSASAAIDVLPAVEPAPGVARRRETTTLLTVDGSLLFRDRLVVDASRTALDVTLPEGAVLWSAAVDGLPVRPVQRGERLTVPLSFEDRGTSVVELVAVAPAAIPPGRSRIRVELPRVGVQVLEHTWRMLLPRDDRYRFEGGDLQPAPLPDVEIEVKGVAPPGGGVGGRRGTNGVVGRVTDHQGSPLPGVRVTLASSALESPLTSFTPASGDFLFSSLPPGSYMLTAALEGLGTDERDLELRGGQTAQADLTLSPAVEEVITVTMESPMLDARQAEGLLRKRRQERQSQAAEEARTQALKELRQGLVGGVKPLEITIPETGKLIFLAGALPPSSVSVELDVKNR